LHNTALISDNNSGTEPIVGAGAVVENLVLDRETNNGRKKMNGRLRFFQTGFSLIELSIATAIFSMGLGSLSMMMLAAIHGTAEARHQTVATIQASSLAEMIAMNSDAYGHYINPPGSEMATCEEDFCQAEAMAAGNMIFWQSQLHNELPGGKGLVCRDSSPDDGSSLDPDCDGDGAVVIKVFWEESRHENSEDGGHRRLVSRLPW
jgi:type IV pilus assembly protein PilV